MFAQFELNNKLAHLLHHFGHVEIEGRTYQAGITPVLSLRPVRNSVLCHSMKIVTVCQEVMFHFFDRQEEASYDKDTGGHQFGYALDSLY